MIWREGGHDILVPSWHAELLTMLGVTDTALELAGSYWMDEMEIALKYEHKSNQMLMFFFSFIPMFKLVNILPTEPG